MNIVGYNVAVATKLPNVTEEVPMMTRCARLQDAVGGPRPGAMGTRRELEVGRNGTDPACPV